MRYYSLVIKLPKNNVHGTLLNVSLTSSSPSTSMTLSFNPLRTSHRGVYWCRATLTDTAANIRLMNNSTASLIILGKLVYDIAYS